MNWDNKTILKFLDLYKSYPCIWDPHNESYKNRQRVNEAWNNIMEALAVSCSVKDLKKKRESLMSAYRAYKSKIKKSERLGAAEVYQPTWFAFSLMDSFLGSIYVCNTTFPVEDEENTEQSNEEFNVIQEDNTDPLSEPSKSNLEPKSPVHYGTSNCNSSDTKPDPPKAKKRPHNSLELIQAKKQMDEAFNFMKNAFQEPKNTDDECSIFGVLVAKKLRKLPEDRRDIMMVKINQLFVDERYESKSSSPLTNHTNSASTMVFKSSPARTLPVTPSTLPDDEDSLLIESVKVEIETAGDECPLDNDEEYS